MSRRDWARRHGNELKKKKQEIERKIKTATTDNEKLKLAKQMLGDVYDKYNDFVSLIPDVEKKIAKLRKDMSLEASSHNPEELKLWEKVLKNLEHVRDRPKAMKLYYAKKVVKDIRIVKKKYPG